MEWNAMMFLGAYHGINPGMGWLFAVALGLQQRSARGVFRALPPIALGHAVAVGATLLAAGLAQLVIPMQVLKVVVAAILTAFGLYRLFRHRHPRYGGMQVGFRDLTIWSFLMASAHGAGLMVLPFVMGTPLEAQASTADSHLAHMAGGATEKTAMLLLGLHTLSYLVVMTLAAWIVYRKLGLAILRTAWLNLDWIWAGALVATGVFTLLR